jgi:hypothetical protein
MIEQLYNNIDKNENNSYDEYLLSLNGSLFKKITDKDIKLNQKKLTPFYMWATSGSIESSAIVSTLDQFKYFVTSSPYDFASLQRNNKNRGNQKIHFNSASFGYVLSDKSLRYDTFHNNVLYYYGYANRFGYGSPFNTTASTAANDIPSESKQISPTKLAYSSIKNLLSDQNFVKGDKIQIKNEFFTDEFVYIKIPRKYYHEELLKGAFEVTLASGSTRLDLADVSRYNINYNEDNIVYLVSASNASSIHYVSGNLDIYGLLDRKNAIALIDVGRINSYFGANTFTTSSFTTQTKFFSEHIYITESFGVVYVDNVEVTDYTASYYPNLEKLSILLYSGSMHKQLKAIGLETQIADEYYIKIGPGEFNRTTNPTYLNNWKIKNQFMDNPVSYVTSVGLYNDEGECLAIAKLSKPLKNDYDSSRIIKIELKQ